MLCEGSGIIDNGDGSTWDDGSRLDWRAVDRALRDIALRRAKLDAEEARWLREAERLQIWRRVGMVSALDYLERVLGHTPHVANERLRVARALGELPVLTDAFARGDLQYSAIRELTRVSRSYFGRWRSHDRNHLAPGSPTGDPGRHARDGDPVARRRSRPQRAPDRGARGGPSPWR